MSFLLTFDKTIGEVIVELYAFFLLLFKGDRDLAAVATAAVINDLLASKEKGDERIAN